MKCQKAKMITNVKGISFAVNKQLGRYPSIYNHEQLLNFNAIRDFSDLFDEFFIVLTDIGSDSKEKQGKVQLIKHFEDFLAGDQQTAATVTGTVTVSTNAQYQQGL